MKISKINIRTNTKNYSIHIGRNLINKIDKILKNSNITFEKCLIVIDKNIPSKFKKTLFRKLKSKKKYKIELVPSEKIKTNITIQKIHKILFEKRFNRSDCVISVGGGIIGDIVGFASSTFKRGLKFINIPTTLLSQVDSSIGGKTGINNKYGKNLVGSFYQPDLVVSDINILNSLPEREIICGYAEILKSSIIDSYKSFVYIDKNLEKILKLKSPFIENSILKACNLKKIVVEKDVNEKNFRKVLNLGHTFAHAYESTLGFSKKLNHGEAVILGIKSAAEFSLQSGTLSKNKLNIILSHINRIGMKTKINNFFKKKDTDKILNFMKSDKKNNSEKINLILIKNFGKIKIDFQIDPLILKRYILKSLN
ncbi:3-dehydroquinate synthase [Candidatus Pelagibacter sp.]|nr:3-dehydroquinate synthase [Candidatus Pelagibacter sp.]MDA9723557.1 3-dehydroquinate synthase [Candidatus Pelagibacter sp.]